VVEMNDIDIDVFFCYNFYRRNRHRRAKRNSGGLVIYIKESYTDIISVVPKTIIVQWDGYKFNQSYFSLDVDIY
jgi:hypothetical protein